MKLDEDRIHGLVQGALAIIVVGSACAIAVTAVLRGQSVPDVPAWLTLAIGAILGFFFGQGTAQKFRQGVTTATNGMLDAASKIAAGAAAQQAAGTEDTRSSS